MSLVLKIILAVMSVIACIYALRKIRKSQLRIEDALFWIIISIMLVIISVFPGLAEFFAGIIGIEAPSNFVFLVMIFLLLVKTFSLSIKLSQTEERLKNLVQKTAIINNETEKEIDALKAEKRSEGNDK